MPTISKERAKELYNKGMAIEVWDNEPPLVGVSYQKDMHLMSWEELLNLYKDTTITKFCIHGTTSIRKYG